MIFDETLPLKTDPSLADLYSWLPSKEANAYYAWIQPVSDSVGFHQTLPPFDIDLGFGVILRVYYGVLRQELLYRLLFTQGIPTRFILKPSPYCLFWSFGSEGGQSKSIKYHYRDRFLSLHEWTDKSSFLAVLRQQHYENNLNTIWTR